MWPPRFHVATYTWNTRPVYSVVPIGTIINVNDVGGAGGSLWRAASAGWVPLNGSVVLASKQGSIAAPVATLTGTTGALFTISGGNGSLVIPATMLIPGHSTLRLRALFHRRGANATASANIYIGTEGSSADPRAFFLNMVATNLQQNRADAEVSVTTSSTMNATTWLAPGVSAADGAKDLTTNINTNAAMNISFGISSANAADAFDLISYSVVLESI